MATNETPAEIHSLPGGQAEDPAAVAARQERQLKGIGPAIVALTALFVLALIAVGLVVLFVHFSKPA